MKKIVLSGIVAIGMAVGFSGCVEGFTNLPPKPYNMKIEQKSELSLMEKQKLLNQAIVNIHKRSNDNQSFIYKNYDVLPKYYKDYYVKDNCIESFKQIKIEGTMISDLYSNCYTINYNDKITKIDKSGSTTSKGQKWTNNYGGIIPAQYAKYVNYIQDNLAIEYKKLLNLSKVK